MIGKPKTIAKQAEEQGVDYEWNQKGGLILNDDNSETRRFVERCYRTSSTMVNPILDWTDEDVWEYLKFYRCHGNPLYYCGESRVGCIGCPMGGLANRMREFARYPKYRENYILTFDRMLIARREAGLNNVWENGEAVMRWWLEAEPEDQIRIDFGEEIDDETDI